MSDSYRNSHLRRGRTYDATLADAPFDAYMNAWEQVHLKRIVPKLITKPTQRYLDFACGTGRITAVVSEIVEESIGVDISESMISEAKRKLPDVDFRVCDLTRTDSLREKFDLITAFRFFGNAEPELRISALKAISDRLELGGHLILNLHRNPYAIYAMLNRFTGGADESMDLSFGKMRSLLVKNGFKVKQTYPVGAWMYRSGLLSAYSPDNPVAVANETRFRHEVLGAISPDCIVVAMRE